MHCDNSSHVRKLYYNYNLQTTTSVKEQSRIVHRAVSGQSNYSQK